MMLLFATGMGVLGVITLIGAHRNWRWLVDPPASLWPFYSQALLKRLFGARFVRVSTYLVGAGLIAFALVMINLDFVNAISEAEQQRGQGGLIARVGGEEALLAVWWFNVTWVLFGLGISGRVPARPFLWAASSSWMMQLLWLAVVILERWRIGRTAQIPLMWAVLVLASSVASFFRLRNTGSSGRTGSGKMLLRTRR